MNFRRKIDICYLLVVMFFTIGFLFCMQTLGPVERSFEQMSHENLPVLNLIHDIRNLGIVLDGEMQEIALHLLSERTPENLQAIEAELLEIARTRQQLLRDVEEYRNLVMRFFPEESDFIPRLEMQVDKLVRQSEIVAAMAEHPSDTPVVLKGLDFEELEEQFLTVTGEIASFEMKEIMDRREIVYESLDQAREHMIRAYLLALAAVVVMGIFAAKIIRSISLSSTPD